MGARFQKFILVIIDSGGVSVPIDFQASDLDESATKTGSRRDYVICLPLEFGMQRGGEKT